MHRRHRFCAHFWVAVALFAIGYACVSAAFAFYTALLPAVSNEQKVATVARAAVVFAACGGAVWCVRDQSLT